MDLIKKYNFFYRELSWNTEWANASGNFKNDFVDNGDGTITDRATGLMWQQGGSKSTMWFEDAADYVERINQMKLAGYSDWRLPTLEELASLLEPVDKDDLYIDLIFDRNQRRCWLSDQSTDGGAWSVLFNLGYVSRNKIDSWVRLVRHGQ